MGQADHLVPFLGFLRDQLAEVGRRAADHRAIQLGKPRLDAVADRVRIVPVRDDEVQFGRHPPLVDLPDMQVVHAHDARLRRKVAELELEREILKKAAVFFARETGR